MARRRSNLDNVRFREICETVTRIDNRDWDVKVARLFVRYLTRRLGYSLTASVLRVMLPAIKWRGKTRKQKYISYLFEVNKLRIEYINCLSSSSLRAAVIKKNQW